MTCIRVITPFVIVFCLLATSNVLPQSKEELPSSATAIQSKSEDVLLDVIVRDKSGRPVTDLKPEDFQIFDNGEPRKIDSFRLVHGTEMIATGGVRTKLDPLRQIRLITMIFQCWSTDARRLAHDAALGLLKGELPPNVYIAVMTIDHSIEVVQTYTNDSRLLRKAIDRATVSGSTDFSADTLAVYSGLQGADAPEATTTADKVVKSPTDTMDAMMAAIIKNTRRNAATQEGRIAIYALLDAVKEQYRLPGRKSVLYFREGGFSIPQGSEQVFENVISVANRSNVSFYAIDAQGLTPQALNSAAASRLNDAAQVGGEGVMSSTDDRVGDTDAIIEGTRANTQLTLRNLAESTGGTLIANTNDLAGPLHRFAEDVQTYYEISYPPEVKNYDGSFHKITVKVKESNLRVQSRSGYFALPPALKASSADLQAYEVPLLNALDAGQPPRDFAFHSGVMHFQDEKDRPVSVLAIDVPFANLTFAAKDENQFEARLSYEALVRNEAGEVIKKFQNEIPINVPSEKLEALKNSRFIYADHFELPPGHYTVAVAVLDSEKENRISVRKTSLTVSAPRILGLSSVSFIRHLAEKDAAAEISNPYDPLLVGSKVISPDLDPVAHKITDKNLPFYLVVYTANTVATPPRLTMELSAGGMMLGRTEIDLGKADGQGRIQYVGTIPAGVLSPGEYSVRFVLQQGAEGADETAFFRVQ
jgi:VWFA-related protein